MSDIIIKARVRDLGGFSVARSLPHATKRSVGPYVFLDHMGPMRVTQDSKLDVRPHPHIGLSTVTYLYSGVGYHRDSLGNALEIKPGELNWMTAGSGIVHSERTPESEINSPTPRDINGIQIWVALPVEFEKTSPSFTHYGKDLLPAVKLGEDIDGTLLIGEFQGLKSPVKTHSPMIFMELRAKSEFKDVIGFDDEEIGIFLVEGSACINSQMLELDDLIVVKDPKHISLVLSEGTKIVIIGGKSFPEPRYIWWNFVSSNKEDIHDAAKRWKEQTFPKVPGETEFTPLPNDPLP